MLGQKITSKGKIQKKMNLSLINITKYLNELICFKEGLGNVSQGQHTNEN